MTVLRATLLGGVDGVITSFAIVVAAYGGGVAQRSVLALGLASVAADGLSMGISEYLSNYSERVATNKTRSYLQPLYAGLACFGSFVLFGLVPLLTYVATDGVILSATMFALVELMLLGAGRTVFSGEPLLRGLMQTALLGSCAGAVAYGVGYAVAIQQR